MPYDSMPSRLQVVASLNPVSYAIDTTRSVMTGQVVYEGTLVLAAMFLIVTFFAIRIFRKMTI